MYETEETDSDKIPKWNFKKANWEKFNILCHEKLLFNSFENSEDPMLSFTETLIDISNQCIAKSSTNSFKKKKPWFNDECKEAIKKRKDSLKRFKQYPTKTLKCLQNLESEGSTYYQTSKTIIMERFHF